MRLRDLIARWDEAADQRRTAREYQFRLPVRDAARVEALAKIYPHCTVERILTDLLGAALDELEAALPYVPGDQVIAEDDRGDPIYADAGPTPRFRALTAQRMTELEKQSGGD